MSTKEIATKQQSQPTIASLIKEQIPAIQMAVAGGSPEERQKRAERFARVALTTIRNSPQLMQCNQASVVGALMTAASLDLDIDPRGLAYLVPYKGEAQLQIGYKGLKELAYRSGKIKRIYDDVVYRAEIEADMFRIIIGLDRALEHRVDPLRPELRQGEIVLAYAVAVFSDDTRHFEYVDRFEVEKRKKVSQSAQGKYPQYSPWNTWEAEMWKKSAVKKLARALPQSAEQFQRAVALDEMADANARQPLDVPEEFIDVEPVPRATTDELNAKLAKDKDKSKEETAFTLAWAEPRGRTGPRRNRMQEL